MYPMTYGKPAYCYFVCKESDKNVIISRSNPAHGEISKIIDTFLSINFQKTNWK